MGKAEEVNIIKATTEHGCWLSEHLNDMDAAEVAATGLPASVVVLGSLENSAHAWTAICEEGIICMWGISRNSSMLGTAVPWLLTSPLIDKYARHFARHAVVIVNEMRKEYQFLESMVDSRHERALRFLNWLGFTISEGQPVGPNRVPFHKFSIGA